MQFPISHRKKKIPKAIIQVVKAISVIQWSEFLATDPEVWV
jgi:hypothetical protein